MSSKYFDNENGLPRDGFLNSEFLEKFNKVFKKESSGLDEKIEKAKDEYDKAGKDLQAAKDALKAASKAHDEAYHKWMVADGRKTAVSDGKRKLREKLLSEFVNFLKEKERLEQAENEEAAKVEFMTKAAAKFA
jgi:hypothetical protein